MYRIGIWGPVSSGKTVFLAALIASVVQQYAEKYTFLPKEGEQASVDFAKNSGKNLVNMAFEKATETDKEPEFYRFILSSSNSLGNDGIEIDMLDTSGRYITSASTHHKGFMDSICSCDGIIIIFDKKDERQDGYLLELAENLRATEKTRRLAFCMTKVDTPISETRQKVANPEKTVKDNIHPQSFNRLVQIVGKDNISCSLVSSVGFCKEGQTWIPNIFYSLKEGKPMLRHTGIGWKPYNIFKPLKDLLTDRDGLPAWWEEFCKDTERDFEALDLDN